MRGNKLGLTLGSFAALVHLVWAILVAIGWAGPLSLFIHRMHFINDSVMILPFDFGRAVGLVLIVFIIGYIVGNTIAWLCQCFKDIK